MQTRTKKTILSIVASVLMCLLFLLTSCSVDNLVMSELPDEEIVNVVKLVVDENGEETEIELSEEKISQFYDYLSVLKYKKKSNIFGIKSREFDDVRYIITYDSYTVKFSEHYLLVLHNGENEKEISFSTIIPGDTFEQIDELFQ